MIEEVALRKFVNSCKNTKNMIVSYHLTTIRFGFGHGTPSRKITKG
jgi:hypothetical protein